MDRAFEQPGYRRAFWAAYEALSAVVALAEVRGDMAARTVDVLVERRAHHGMGHMLQLAQGGTEGRGAINRSVVDGKPSSYAQVTHTAIDSAVKAAAEVLADGKD